MPEVAHVASCACWGPVSLPTCFGVKPRADSLHGTGVGARLSLSPPAPVFSPQPPDPLRLLPCILCVQPVASIPIGTEPRFGHWSPASGQTQGLAHLALNRGRSSRAGSGPDRSRVAPHSSMHLVPARAPLRLPSPCPPAGLPHAARSLGL